MSLFGSREDRADTEWQTEPVRQKPQGELGALHSSGRETCGPLRNQPQQTLEVTPLHQDGQRCPHSCTGGRR